jgi:DNA-binding MarR family transcriptional regulator
VDQTKRPIVPEQEATDAYIEALESEFRAAFRRLYRRLRAERASDQIGESHRTVLKRLVEEGPHSLRELSDLERVTPPSMSQTVNALVESGFVKREGDPNDGRKVIVAPTEEGISLIAATRRCGHVWLHEQIVRLSEDEQQALFAATAIITKLADS